MRKVHWRGLVMLGVRPQTKAGELAISRPNIPNIRTGPRNLSTAQGGGMFTSQGEGMRVCNPALYGDYTYAY